MKTGPISFDSPLVLAPLAGYTDSPMRRIARRFGASMVWTEMVSAEGAVRESEATLKLLAFDPAERPIAFQVFGARPEGLAGAAARIERLGPDVIDLNAGCPARKVVKSGSGAALMRSPRLLAEIVEALVEAVAVPVTAKIRSGWDADEVNAAEVASVLEASGAAAVVVHPRTRAQGFKGSADWSVIADVRRAVAIPVIGSGDVLEPADALRMLEETRADAVMIGRGAVGNPWIFKRAVAMLAGGDDPGPPSLEERIDVAIEHLDLMVSAKGEHKGVIEMRKHLVSYLRGAPGVSRVRGELVRMEGHANVRDRLESARRELA
jgi:tRNA-dihydrouridine synthase B